MVFRSQLLLRIWWGVWLCFFGSAGAFSRDLLFSAPGLLVLVSFVGSVVFFSTFLCLISLVVFVVAPAVILLGLVYLVSF